MAEKKRMQKPHYESICAFLKGEESTANPECSNANSENPWEYDFKYQYDNGNASKYWNLDEEKDALRRFLKYKHDAANEFDCDGSGERYSCDLTREIYRALWSWQDKDEKGNKKRFGSLASCALIAFGPDTMNSFMTTFIHFLKLVQSEKLNAISTKTIYEQFVNNSGVLEEYCKTQDLAELWESFAVYTHSIGNFILVPAGFNGKRGMSSAIHDFWDLSLVYLKHMVQEKSYFSMADAFTKYINMFFLWDYVSYSEDRKDYRIKSLLSNDFVMNISTCSNNHLGISDVDSSMPTLHEIGEFLLNVRWAIRRRGIFMTAMLQLQQEIGEEKYSRLRNDIFAVDTCYKGFDCVIARVVEWLNDNDWVLPDTVRKTLEKEWTVPESKVEPSSK